MPWVRFDDQFPIHRKVDGLSDAAYRLHTSAIFWSARNLTDGFVSEDDLDGVTARVRTPARFASECVKRDTWHEAGTACPSLKCPPAPDGETGWVIHDYWAYQPTKAQVLADREKAAGRQAKWREAKSGRNAVTQPSMPQSVPIHNGSSNGVTNAVSASSPPRPAPKGSGAGSPGRPSGRPDSKTVTEALRNGIEPGHRASPGAYESGPELARRLLAEKRAGDPP